MGGGLSRAFYRETAYYKENIFLYDHDHDHDHDLQVGGLSSGPASSFKPAVHARLYESPKGQAEVVYKVRTYLLVYICIYIFVLYSNVAKSLNL